MLYRERKRNKDMQLSEAVEHYKSEEDLSAEKSPAGYIPHWEERDEQSRPREMLGIENAFGNVSIAVNRKKEMTIAISQKKRPNSKTLKNDCKVLNGQRRKGVNAAIGYMYTNNLDPINSAFAFKIQKIYHERKVLERMDQFVDKKGQNAVENMLPFFNLKKDKTKLQKLEAEIRSALEKGLDPHQLEREKEQLASSIAQKEQMQARFTKKMRLAINKARKVSAEEWYQPLITTVIPGEVDTADVPPEDEEDITEGLLKNLKGRKSNLFNKDDNV